jgi:hypothetical protein
MARIVIIGREVALVEGLAQTLGATGHAPMIATSVPDAIELTAGSPPLLAVVERALAEGSAEALRIPLAPGGALVLYQSDPGAGRAALSRAVQRLTLAELTLPLERQRLVALAQSVEGRAISTGRGGQASPDAAPSEGEQRA